MKTLILASSIGKVAHDFIGKLDDNKRKLAFIITASEQQAPEELDWRHDNRKTLVDLGFYIEDYTITGKDKQKIAHDLAQFDILCFEGGNPFYLLEQMQKSDCIGAIRDLVVAGKIYLGSSAGSMVAGPNILPLRHRADDIFLELKAPYGLGLVDFIVLPHFGSEIRREVNLGGRLQRNYDEKYKRIFLTDNQYLWVEDDWLKFIDVSR